MNLHIRAGFVEHLDRQRDYRSRQSAPIDDHPSYQPMRFNINEVQMQ